MEKITAFFRAAGAVVLSILLSFVSFTAGGNLKIDRGDDVLLRAALISDTHMTDELYRKAVLAPGLRDISKRVQPDAFILAGDCTDNGNEENWQALTDLLEKNLDAPYAILALGNHDPWVTYDTPHDYAPARENFIRYSNAVMHDDHDEVYFVYDVNGYSFFVLGSEGTSTGEELSETQLAWLDGALAEACAADPAKPLFVINHQPMNFTHGVGENEDGMGISTEGASERLLSILDRYENIFYFSGHLHYGLNDGTLGYPEDYATVERVGEHVISVNLPSYEYGSFVTGGNAWIGQGLVMDVYADRVELNGRIFALSNWVRGAEYEFPLAGLGE